MSAAHELHPVYEASHIKRVRSTKDQVERRRAALYDLVRQARPATVRQIFYLASVAGLVPKTEDGYGMVQTDLTLMRRADVLPYDWLADSTRWQRKPRTFGSVKEALEDTARLYRKALWNDADAYVEIWLEKDALAGVVYPITNKFDVPLMVARGYASLSFLHEAADYIGSLDVPAHIYHLGDFDPSGQDAARAIEQGLREMAPDAEIHFERLAVTREQIGRWSLPTRPTKRTDSRAKGFGSVSVELDAIPPGRLRGIVQKAIERHLPPEQYDVLKVAEASERRLIKGLVGMAKSKTPEEEPGDPQEEEPLEEEVTPEPETPQWRGSPESYFAHMDWLTPDRKAEWVLFLKQLRRNGASEEWAVEACAHVMNRHESPPAFKSACDLDDDGGEP